MMETNAEDISKVICKEKLRSQRGLYMKSRRSKDRNGVSISLNMTTKCSVTHCGAEGCKLTGLLELRDWVTRIDVKKANQ